MPGWVYPCISSRSPAEGEHAGQAQIILPRYPVQTSDHVAEEAGDQGFPAQERSWKPPQPGDIPDTCPHRSYRHMRYDLQAWHASGNVKKRESPAGSLPAGLSLVQEMRGSCSLLQVRQFRHISTRTCAVRSNENQHPKVSHCESGYLL